MRDGITLVSGNVWAQVIAFASYLILSRLFSPEDFGFYNVFFSYIEVLVIVSTCKYELAVVLADNDREAAAVSRLALRLNTIISIALLTLLLVLCVAGRSDAFAGTRLATLDPKLALLVPPMVYFCGTSRVYSQLLNRFRKFRQLALSEVVGSTSGVLFKVLFGLPRLAATLWHSIGLPLGTILGRICANINLAVKCRRLGLAHDIGRSERKTVAARFRNFPLFTFRQDGGGIVRYGSDLHLQACQHIQLGLREASLCACRREGARRQDHQQRHQAVYPDYQRRGIAGICRCIYLWRGHLRIPLRRPLERMRLLYPLPSALGLCDADVGIAGIHQQCFLTPTDRVCLLSRSVGAACGVGGLGHCQRRFPPFHFTLRAERSSCQRRTYGMVYAAGGALRV